jgi:hypothetical protein
MVGHATANFYQVSAWVLQKQKQTKIVSEQFLFKVPT